MFINLRQLYRLYIWNFYHFSLATSHRSILERIVGGGIGAYQQWQDFDCGGGGCCYCSQEETIVLHDSTESIVESEVSGVPVNNFNIFATYCSSYIAYFLLNQYPSIVSVRRLETATLGFLREILQLIKMPWFWSWLQKFCATCCIRGKMSTYLVTIAFYARNRQWAPISWKNLAWGSV